MADPKFIVDKAGQVRTVSSEADQNRLAQQGESEWVSKQEAQDAWQNEQDKAYVDERYGTLGKAAMGGLSGLTLGLGPAAAAGLAGLINPEAGELAKRDLRAMQGSGAYLGGEVAGMLVPAIFSGGESIAGRSMLGRVFAGTPMGLVNEVGGAAERLATRLLPESTGLLGKGGSKILSMAARGASEAALMNMGQQASHDIIYNKPLTAESLAASGVEGALFGGLVGGGIGTIGAGASRVADALGSRVAGSAAGRGEALINRELGAGAEDVVRMATRHGTEKEAHKAFHKLLEDAGEQGGFASGTKRINQVAEEAISDSKAVQYKVAGTLDREAPGHVPSLSRIYNRMESEVMAPHMGTYNQQTVRGVLDDTFSKIGNVTESPQGKVWENWMKTRDQLRTHLGDMLEKKVLDPTVAQDIRAKMFSILDDEIAASMSGAAKAIGRDGLAEQFQAAALTQRTAEHLSEMTGRKLADQAIGAKPLVTPLDLAQFGGSAMFNPVWATGMLAAKASTRMLEARVAPKLAEMAYNMGIGAKAAGATANVKSRIGGAVRGFFKGAGTAASASNSKWSVKNRAEYEKRLERAHELTSPLHQARVAEYANKLARNGQLELADQVVQLHNRAATYLLHNLPGSVSAKGATSLRQMPKYDGLDVKDFKALRILSAIEEPLDVVDRMASGDVSRDEVQAVKYVYPELHAEVVSEVSQQIYEMKAAGEHLPADKVAMLGLVLDAAVDSTLEKDFIDGVQASFVAQAPSPEQAPPIAQETGSVAKNFLTPTERALV